jgi:TPR repeat protein
LIITLNSPHILLISKRLAEQGYAWAQVNLGYIYAHGEGVPEDYVKSYAWHSVSAALGAEDAKTS